MDTMGDVGSPKSMDARAKIFNEQVSAVGEAYGRSLYEKTQSEPDMAQYIDKEGY